MSLNLKKEFLLVLLHEDASLIHSKSEHQGLIDIFKSLTPFPEPLFHTLTILGPIANSHASLRI